MSKGKKIYKDSTESIIANNLYYCQIPNFIDIIDPTKIDKIESTEHGNNEPDPPQTSLSNEIVDILFSQENQVSVEEKKNTNLKSNKINVQFFKGNGSVYIYSDKGRYYSYGNSFK